jgi:hypothetical protein
MDMPLFVSSRKRALCSLQDLSPTTHTDVITPLANGGAISATVLLTIPSLRFIITFRT